ncbi:MAG: hypothetical protein JNL81_12680 [Hyphomonadaceae bacterium]|nr:hypothetical protein [Hyphomonadaceae bacterium]
MTWFGPASAWAALLMAAMFAVNAYFQFATGVASWVYVGVAALLFLGGFRTLRKMSGGLRLLAGAWGVAAGLLLMPLTVAQGSPSLLARLSFGEIGFLVVALAGVAMTVLHKETK